MKQIYEDILDGKVLVNEGKKILGSQKVSDDIEVFVTPSLIVLFLIKYVCGEIDSNYLCEWAGFLISNDVYVTPGWEDDSIADKYEPMWEILQNLSTPMTDGPISKTRVEGFIETLKHLD